MDCVVHEVAESQTQLSNFHFHKMQSTGAKKQKYTILAHTLVPYVFFPSLSFPIFHLTAFYSLEK